MRFEEAYLGYGKRGLTQSEAALLLGVCDRTFRRYMNRYDEGGSDALVDQRLVQLSHRRAPVDEVMRMLEHHRNRHMGWNAKHFCGWYRSGGGNRSHTWVKSRLQEAGLIERTKKRGTHQERLPKELVLAGIADMAAANQYLKEIHMPAFNAEFMQAACEEGSAFVPWIAGERADILCERHERVVGHDNCVGFESSKLQIPADRHRCHLCESKSHRTTPSKRTNGYHARPKEACDI